MPDREELRLHDGVTEWGDTEAVVDRLREGVEVRVVVGTLDLLGVRVRVP